jgi:O-antigen ligase
MGLLGIVSLLSKGMVERLTQNIKKPVFWISIGVFLIYAISLLYSSNMKEGIRSITAKLPLLVFSIMYCMLPINFKLFIKIIKIFPLLLLIALCSSFFIQFLAYSDSSDISLLYSDNLGSPFGIQAVYNGLFINIALIIVFWIISLNEISKAEKIGFSAVGLMLFSFQFLVISRIALLLSILIIVIFTIKLLLANKSLKVVIPTLTILIAFPIIAFMSSQKLQNRFSSVFNTEFRYDNPNPINHFNAEQSDDNWNSFTARIATWSCALEVFKTSPIVGHGVGDHFDELIKEYENKNFILGLKEQYNTHNQYFDISIATGMIGLIILILFFTFPIYKGLKTNNALLVGMSTLLAISALTENILNRSQGIIIIAVIYLLIYHAKFINSESKFQDNKTKPI